MVRRRRAKGDSTLRESKHRVSFAEAERIQQQVLVVSRRVLRKKIIPRRVAGAGNMAMTLSYQGNNAEAEQIGREVLDAQAGPRR